MGGLKTLLAALAAASPALAAPGNETDLAQTFAACAGRLSAQMEFQWLMSDAGADLTQAHRAAVVELLEAATPPGEASRLLALRIEAKHAHWSLLTRSAFNRDPEDAEWAARRAGAEIARCTGFVLS